MRLSLISRRFLIRKQLKSGKHFMLISADGMGAGRDLDRQPER